ncbi:MAG: hypothetical protein GF364_10815 [Candidatus Lokiarchaeota archaeon]|nr:hypothetical protein [Candidatus Lokiarchaeota archaeon]
MKKMENKHSESNTQANDEREYNDSNDLNINGERNQHINSLPQVTINKILKGFGFTPTLLFYFYIFPWIFVRVFDQGLEGTSLIVIAVSLPFIFLIYFVLRANIRIRNKIRNISNLLLIPSLFLFGLITKFGFDERSITSCIVVDLVLIFGFYKSILDLYSLPEILDGIKDSQKDGIENDSKVISILSNDAFFFLGIAFALIAVSIINLIFTGIEYLIFSTAILYSLSVVLKNKVVENENSEISEVNKAQESEVAKPINLIVKANRYNRVYMIKFIGILLFWVIQALLIVYSTAEYGYEGYGWVFLGIAVGIISDKLGISIVSELLDKEKRISHHKIKKYILGYGLIALYYAFMIRYQLFYAPIAIFLNGLILGFATDVLIKYYMDKKHKTRFALGRANEAILSVILIVLFGLLAHEMKFIVRDYPEDHWVLPLVAIAIIGIFALFTTLADRHLKQYDTKFMARIKAQKTGLVSKIKIDSLKSYSILPFRPNKAFKTKIFALSMIVMSLSGILSIWLYTESRPYVHITLDTTMYTVNGDPVNDIKLKERTGIILLNSPDPTGFAHDEIIRKNKTVRLGAYLYDARSLGGLSQEEAKVWMAETFDVWSLGGYTEYTIYPDDVLDMKAINPRSRFYIMNFATTQGENDTWSVDGALAPYTIWNETMDEWTLKKNDGTEVIGHRRWSADCGGHYMDLSSMDYADWFAMIWDNRVKEYHADGVAIDEVMWKGYWQLEIDDLRDYNSIEEVTEACYDWIERIDSNMEVDIITQAFWDEAQQYQQGIWGELAFRCGGAYGNRVDDRDAVIFYEPMDWQEIVENMYYHSSLNRSYIWAAWYKRDDMEALEYAVSTYLMGKANENHTLAFHPQPIYDGGYPYNLAGYSLGTVREEINNHPEYFDLELGDALGPMQLVTQGNRKYWKREFTNGMVLVNPFHAFVPGFDTPAEFNPSH